MINSVAPYLNLGSFCWLIPQIKCLIKTKFVSEYGEIRPGPNWDIPDFIPWFSVRLSLTRVKNVNKQLTPIFWKQNLFNFGPWFQNGKEHNFWTSRSWVSIFHSCVFLDLGLMTRVENGNKHLTPIFFNKTCSISSLDSKTVKNIIIFDPKALWWPKFQILSYLSHFLMTFDDFFRHFLARNEYTHMKTPKKSQKISKYDEKQGKWRKWKIWVWSERVTHRHFKGRHEPVGGIGTLLLKK